MCKGVARYCSRKIVEVIEGTQEYWDGDYEGLKREMKFMFDDQQKEVRHTTLHLIKLVQAWKDKDIKTSPHSKSSIKNIRELADGSLTTRRLTKKIISFGFGPDFTQHSRTR